MYVWGPTAAWQAQKTKEQWFASLQDNEPWAVGAPLTERIQQPLEKPRDRSSSIVQHTEHGSSSKDPII